MLDGRAIVAGVVADFTSAEVSSTWPMAAVVVLPPEIEMATR